MLNSKITGCGLVLCLHTLGEWVPDIDLYIMVDDIADRVNDGYYFSFSGWGIMFT